ncbi:YadA-like family protein, partial [Mitsuokella sp.]|uniref:YadA-like family protein n=1 Tax=Mitsuokella sp. TaxID=2049034 RepID=UPI003D7D8E69
GDSIVNILKDADNGFVQSNVSKGDNSTSVKQTSTDITNTAKNGTIANDAKNINNSATEKLSNSAAEIENTATTSITSKVGNNVSNTMSTDSIVNKVGTTTVTTTDGKTKLTNEAGTHGTEMDYATVLKDLGVHGNAMIDQNLTVKGDSDLQGNAMVGKNLTVNGTSDLKGNVTMESNATVKNNLTVEGTTTTNKLVVENGATVTGGTKTDTLYVTSTSTFDGPATFKDIVTMEKDLTVGGNAAVTGSVTASSYKVGDTTYIDANGINANNQKVTNVAAGDLSAASTDAVNGSQLYSTNQRVSTVENRVDGVENRVTNVENRVDKMDSRIDKVGANAAAMANLHPLEFDEDSKWNVAAAVGNYKGETAAAVGAFYRPNEDVMFNLSTTFGNDENMVGGGVSLRLGKGGNHEKDKKLKAALAENNDLRSKVDNLTARMDALLSVLNPSMSKDFPDVPANHWAYEAVSRLAGNDIVQGYADGKFHGERTMTRYEMAEIIYNALSKGAKAEKKLVEEFKPELQAMAAQKQAK